MPAYLGVCRSALLLHTFRVWHTRLPAPQATGDFLRCRSRGQLGPLTGPVGLPVCGSTTAFGRVSPPEATAVQLAFRQARRAEYLC